MADLLETPLLIFRVHKRATGNPDYQWINTYEAQSGTTGWDSYTLLDAVANELVDGEALIHTGLVEFTRVVYGTWTAESEYEPESFRVVELTNTFGTRAVAGDILDRSFCLLVKREAETGRSGRLYYRGVLSEQDIASGNDLVMQLETASVTSLQASLDAMYSDVQAALVAAGGVGSSLAMLGPVPGGLPTRRNVTDLTVRGVVVNRPTRRWFNRT